MGRRVRQAARKVTQPCVLCSLKSEATELWDAKGDEPADLQGWLGGVLFGFSQGLLIDDEDPICGACQRVLDRVYGLGPADDESA